MRTTALRRGGGEGSSSLSSSDEGVGGGGAFLVDLCDFVTGSSVTAFCVFASLSSRLFAVAFSRAAANAANASGVIVRVLFIGISTALADIFTVIIESVVHCSAL